jgi:hypothetical protein
VHYVRLRLFQSRGIAEPAALIWWLDVERTNSWETATVANVADLEGMARYLQSIDASVGIYASRSDWSSIAGVVKATSPLSSLPNWIAGATSLAAGQAACAAAPLMAGRISVVQYDAGSVDYDISCS